MTAWKDPSLEKPTKLQVRIKLIDGSEINAWAQLDGYFYWPNMDIFIPGAKVTGWVYQDEILEEK